MSTTAEFNAAIERAFHTWVENNDPDNKLTPIEQARAFNDYMRSLRGLPPLKRGQHGQPQ